MTHIVDRDGALFVQDSPGFHWLLGLLFLGVGSLFVLGPLWLFVDRTVVASPVRALSVFLGGIGIGAGLWVLSRSPHSIIAGDRPGGPRPDPAPGSRRSPDAFMVDA